MLKICFKSILFLFMISDYCTAIEKDCKSLHHGVFKNRSSDGSIHTIIRTADKQTEYSGINGLVSEFGIIWTSDCTYLLFNHSILSGMDSSMSIVQTDTLYNEIIDANNFWNKIAFSTGRNEKKFEADYFMVDTTTLYRDINELKKFSEYNGYLRGGSVIANSYVATYRQHSTDKQKFLLAFEEGLPLPGGSKFKLLDEIIVTADTNQHFAIRNCRLNDIYNDEIMALYISDNPKKEARIIKAWHFNKTNFKIEQIPINNIKYRETDIDRKPVENKVR